jgi:hypothetical protein
MLIPIFKDHNNKIKGGGEGNMPQEHGALHYIIKAYGGVLEWKYKVSDIDNKNNRSCLYNGV